MGWQLDLMILEVFSNLNVSVILWFYKQKGKNSKNLIKTEHAQLFLAYCPDSSVTQGAAACLFSIADPQQ